MGKNSGADGSMTDGAGPIKGPYYPKKGGSTNTSNGYAKANAPWTPDKSDSFTKRSGSGTKPMKYAGSNGTVTRQSVWAVSKGAQGPDGSGNGTDHSTANKPDSDRKPKRGSYNDWPKADTTAYGGKNTGKLK